MQNQTQTPTLSDATLTAIGLQAMQNAIALAFGKTIADVSTLAPAVQDLAIQNQALRNRIQELGGFEQPATEGVQTEAAKAEAIEAEAGAAQD